jgi:hypothetical protein
MSRGILEEVVGEEEAEVEEGVAAVEEAVVEADAVVEVGLPPPVFEGAEGGGGVEVEGAEVEEAGGGGEEGALGGAEGVSELGGDGGEEAGDFLFFGCGGVGIKDWIHDGSSGIGGGGGGVGGSVEERRREERAEESLRLWRRMG